MELRHELSGASLVKLLSFLAWSWLYLWVAATWKDVSPEWCSRVVTLLHGSVASVVGLAQCSALNISDCSLTTKILAHQYALMVWSWGYFAFDLLWCLVYWTNNALMLCHHASALAAITIYMQKDYTGCTFACFLALMEVTNPLLQTRWFLKNEGYGKTLIFYIVEALYLGLFLFLRGMLGTYFMVKIYKSDIFDMDEKMISLVLYLVSLAFIYDIFGYIIYKYKDGFVSIQQIIDEMGVILNDEQ